MPAIQEATTQVVEDYYISDGRNIELGSGEMSLSSMAKNVGRDFKLTEIDKYAHFFSRKDREAIRADFSQLPLPDESVDRFFGFNAFTVIRDQDLKVVFEEIHRALKPDGIFVHMNDVQPKIETILIPYLEKGFLPVPALGERGHIEAAYLMRESDVRDFRRSLKDELSQKAFEAYANDPVRSFGVFMTARMNPQAQGSAQTLKFLQSLNEAIGKQANKRKKALSISKTRPFVQAMHDKIMKFWVETSLFEVVEDKKRTVEAMMDKPRRSGNFSVIESNAGIFRIGKIEEGDEVPPEGKWLARVKLPVTALRKIG